MKDREPRDIAKTGQWVTDGIAQRFGQDAEPRLDPVFGRGVEIPLARQANAEHGERSVSLYPNEGVIFVQTPNASIYLRNAVAPREAVNGMLVETENKDARLLVLDNGHIALEVFPVVTPTPRESPTSDQEAPSSSEAADMPEEWRTLPYSAVQDTAETSPGLPLDTPSAPESQERQPRIKVTGFVATEPNMKPTPAGKPRVQFLVAEHPETPEGEEPRTVYHHIYTLNKTAERLQGKGIEKGKKVAVDGYVQERKRKGKNGEEETYPVIYANHVRVLYVHKPVDY